MNLIVKKVYFFLFLIISAYSLQGQTVVFWNFETGTNPTSGIGSITNFGGISSTFNSSINAMGGQAYNTTSYPSQGTGSGTAGIQVTTSTEGKADIFLSWIHRHSGSSSKYIQIQVSTDGINFSPFPLTLSNATSTLLTEGSGNSSTIDSENGLFVAVGEDSWHRRTVNLSSLSGINNNPNFSFRITPVFAPGTSSYQATGIGRNYATNGTQRYDSLTVLAGTILPLRMGDINIVSLSKGLKLEWETYQESMIEGFDIQRSTNGNDFTNIGFVKAFNGDKQIYTYIDPKPQVGNNFYRLQIKQKDGLNKYSAIVLAKWNTKSSEGVTVKNIYPLLSTNNINIEVEADKPSQFMLRILGTQGQLLQNISWLVGTGITQRSLNISSLSPGTYYLQVFTNQEQIELKRFVKY